MCQPCQASLALKVRTHRPTLAALAGAVYGLSLNASLQHSAVVSPTTRAWQPLALAAAASGDGTAAFTAVEEMDNAQASELLEDALDHWALGGVAEDVLKVLDLDPQENTTTWTGADSGGPGGIPVIPIGLPESPDGVPKYAVLLTRMVTPDGQQFPMLTLECETAGAGIDDLRRRTDWRAWDARSMPELDFNWRVRVDIATRSLRCLVHIDREGNDDPHLWDAAEKVPLPENWWNLLDRAARSSGRTGQRRRRRDHSSGGRRRRRAPRRRRPHLVHVRAAAMTNETVNLSQIGRMAGVGRAASSTGGAGTADSSRWAALRRARSFCSRTPTCGCARTARSAPRSRRAHRQTGAGPMIGKVALATHDDGSMMEPGAQVMLQRGDLVLTYTIAGPEVVASIVEHPEALAHADGHHRTGVNVASFALVALRGEGVRGGAMQAYPRLRGLLRAIGDAPYEADEAGDVRFRLADQTGREQWLRLDEIPLSPTVPVWPRS
jgi:hypothetical protein